MALWHQTDWLASMWRQRNQSQKTPVVHVPAPRGPDYSRTRLRATQRLLMWGTRESGTLSSAIYELYACCSRPNR